jgi:hypothetical protein
MMDTLHTMMRTISSERKAEPGAASRRDHLTVFREFLDHLDRACPLPCRSCASAAGCGASRRDRDG